MLLAALIDLGADDAAVRAVFERLGEPGLTLTVERVLVNGVEARYVRSLPAGDGHHHHHLSDVLDVIDRSSASPRARERARRIFGILADAEAVVHGGTAD